MLKKLYRILGSIAFSLFLLASLLELARADNVYQPLPFFQDWSNTGLITVSDDWSGVPGIQGFRGDDLTTAIGADPQLILADGASTPLDVNANQTNPDTYTTGGVTEFHLANPVVALQGSGTADAPHLVFYIDTTGLENIVVSYSVRDVDNSADNTNQQVALQYRVGETGDFINVPAGYIADASAGPTQTMTTPITVTLPSAVDNQPQVQIRVMTTNAPGSDEWIGIDDISITGMALATPIGTARAAGPGWSGLLRGNVTVPPGVFDADTFAIQDSTGGIYVIQGSGLPALSLGDLVEVDGTLTLANGLLLIDSPTAITQVTSGTPPAPQVVSTAPDVVSATQGSLVQVTGVATWTTPPPAAGTADWTMTIDDGSGPVQVFVDQDTAIDMTGYTSPVYLTVVGFSGSDNGTPQIMPRYQADITLIPPPAVVSTMPASDAVDVGVGQIITATFDKALEPATVNDSTFTLTGPDGSLAAAVGYDDVAQTAILTPSASLSATSRYTATLSTGITDLLGQPMAAEYTWSFDTGVVDLTPPTIVAHWPASDETGVSLDPTIVITFSEALKLSTVIMDNFSLEGPGGSIAWSNLVYDPVDYRVSLTPVSVVPLAVHTVTVSTAVSDPSDNPVAGDLTWSFTTRAVPVAHVYFGSIHNHTSYSDGALTPADAFAAGRARGLDFMAVTDHSNSLTDLEWTDTLTAANAATEDGAYVAIRGTEYTQSTEGHINIYGTDRFVARSCTSGSSTYCDAKPYLSGFYDWVTIHPETLGHFNHPAWMNFNDWAYRAAVEPNMQLIEVGNGADSYYVWTEEEYRKALDYGWRAGPTNNGDTHDTRWALDNPGRTGLWAYDLTYDGVMEALRAMRTFATEDGNLELYLKADGAWMGETIASSGVVSFEVYANDPDGESLTSVILYTDQGQVAASGTPGAGPYLWQFSLPVSQGVHYFYVSLVQADGDRAVSAPIWTAGTVDVAPTKLDITPAQLSTLAPANLTTRVTNRGAAAASNVTVEFWADSTLIGSQVVTVAAGADAFATLSWSPSVTGSVTISTSISNVPAGDNLDDNSLAVQRYIVGEGVPLILIDNGHTNQVFTSGDGADFKNDLVAHGLNWLEDTDGITTSDLASAVLLVISDPGSAGQDLFSDAEEQVIADYVNNGGSLLIAGDSNYHDNGNPGEINSILARITGSRIRVNTDGTYTSNPDDRGNPSWGYNIKWHHLPGAASTGIGTNVNVVIGYSGASIYGVDGGTPVPLTDGNGVTITVVGDSYVYQEPTQIVTGTFVYSGTGVPIPMAAVQELPTGGRIAVWGDSQEQFSNSYTYVPGDGYQNEIYNMQTIRWLLRDPVFKQTVAEARVDASEDNTPDNLDKLTWVEGIVTVPYGNFYDSLVVQDDTGGITVYAPVTSLASTLTLGSRVRVVGRIETYQGDTEIQIDWDPEQVQVIGQDTVPAARSLTCAQTMLESNEGWLAQVTGQVITKTSDYILIVEDGSGQCRLFIDAYNGDFSGVNVGDEVRATGVVSEDGNGNRLRLRNEADLIDPFVITNPYYLPIITRSAHP